jgi:hypothetical protein
MSLWQLVRIHCWVMCKSILRREQLPSWLGLQYFAKMYASKFNVDEKKMMERLWGENCYDPAIKKWTNKSTGSPTCQLGFVQFVYNPIKQITNVCMNDQKDKLWPMMAKLGCSLKGEEKDLMSKALMKRVMQSWLPASSALLEMMIYHLPSLQLPRNTGSRTCMRAQWMTSTQQPSGTVIQRVLSCCMCQR